MNGRLRYDVVDVFTDRPFAGNPLAVVYEADSLTGDQLAAVALEFNLSETAFPIAPTGEDCAAGADYRVRIFTPGGEIPFAGHPTLGTAWSLRKAGVIEPGIRLQACGTGIIGVQVPAEDDRPVELTVRPRDHARVLGADDAAQLASMVGLTVADLVGDAYAAGCGLSWLYLTVTADAVTRSRPSSQRLSEAPIELGFLADPVDGIAVVTLRDGAEEPADIGVSARVFVPGFGIAEDPATGSAAAGLGLVLVAAGIAAGDGQTTYAIRQGMEMGRPSMLRGRVEARDGHATLVHVAGQVVPVGSGTIRVP